MSIINRDYINLQNTRFAAWPVRRNDQSRTKNVFVRIKQYMHANGPYCLIHVWYDTSQSASPNYIFRSYESTRPLCTTLGGNRFLFAKFDSRNLKTYGTENKQEQKTGIAFHIHVRFSCVECIMLASISYRIRNRACWHWQCPWFTCTKLIPCCAISAIWQLHSRSS